ncbi:hypothetical protein SLEP1_g54191 [Rubroshorea leprosula]|uniref:Disease resistance N-terminal domain-containing protein n=1 Tax=Rubroshorea leprosula TaxID=152421 RepID=A0AAV5MCP9_9ROSI|nr:hypothetical protein SLEP1_g54191 [Rubroshorea leprosula]
MEVATLAGGALLSATFELLLSKLNSLANAEEKQGKDLLVKLWLADLKDLVYDMEDILEEVEIDAKRLELFAKSQQKIAHTPLPEHYVYGRENDKEAILQILLSDEGRHEPYSVIPIVRMGRIEKSTLAWLIYNDDKLKDRFGLKA